MAWCSHSRLCCCLFTNSSRCCGWASLDLSSLWGLCHRSFSFDLMAKSWEYQTIHRFARLHCFESLSFVLYKLGAAGENLLWSRGQAGANSRTQGSWADSTRTSPWSTKCWRCSLGSTHVLNESTRSCPDWWPRRQTSKSRSAPYLARRRSAADRHPTNRRSDISDPKAPEFTSLFWNSLGFQRGYAPCSEFPSQRN